MSIITDMSNVNWIDKSILIVEDDRFNALIIENFLKETRATLKIANSGEKAVEMAKALNPDVILMDIKLPGIDGKEATRLIRQFLPNVIIIAQTAFVTDTDKEEALSAGCNDFISKPIKFDKLIQVIMKFL